MNIIVSKYVANDSFLDRFDPRFKLMSFIFLAVFIFLPLGFIPYFLLGLLFLWMYLWCNLPLKTLRNILLGTFFIFIFLIFFNMFEINLATNTSHSIGGGHDHSSIFFEKIIVWKNFLSFKEQGLFNAIYYAMRVFLILLLTTMLVFTISISKLILGLESLLWPLKKIGIPIHIFTMIITLTFRFLPTIVEEANTIILAQSSRGLDFHNAPWNKKIKALIALIIPLLSSIFQRNHEMTFAMEARGYNPYKEKTNLKFLILNRLSYFLMMIVLFIFIFGLIIYFNQINFMRLGIDNYIFRYHQH